MYVFTYMHVFIKKTQQSQGMNSEIYKNWKTFLYVGKYVAYVQRIFPNFPYVWQINHRNTVERTIEVTQKRSCPNKNKRTKIFFRLLHKIEKRMMFLKRGHSERYPIRAVNYGSETA